MEVEKSCSDENISVNNDNYIREVIDDTINNIIKTEGYFNYTVKKEILTSNGDSFLGAHCQVDINGETKDGIKKSNIFMKICSPKHEVAFIDLTQAYCNELFVYNELANVYATFQEEHNVPLDERYEMIKYYNGRSQDVVALENMRDQGFVTHNRMEMVSLDFVELALVKLAKFHTMSFVLEHKRPTYFDKNIKNIRSPFKYNDAWNQVVTGSTDIAIALVDKDAKIKLVNFTKELTKNYIMHLVDENTIRCLCHGDYRTSNILMKNLDGVISKVIPIDYQLIYYGSPVLDFLYLIFGATDREFRQKHLQHLKNLYHNTVEKFLEYFNMEVDKVFPRKEFERVFEAKLDYGLMISLISIPVLLAEDNMMDVNATSLTTSQANEECKRRLSGAIDEFIEWGYL